MPEPRPARDSRGAPLARRGLGVEVWEDQTRGAGPLSLGPSRARASPRPATRRPRRAVPAMRPPCSDTSSAWRVPSGRAPEGSARDRHRLSRRRARPAGPVLRAGHGPARARGARRGEPADGRRRRARSASATSPASAAGLSPAARWSMWLLAAGPVDGTLVEELVDWFRDRYGATDCDAILGGDPSARLSKCPGIVTETYERARALVEDRGLWSPEQAMTAGPSAAQRLSRLPAPAAGEVVRDGDEVWLRRVCPEHGETAALVWRGAAGLRRLAGGRRGRVVLRAGGEPGVPDGVRPVRRPRAADVLRAPRGHAALRPRVPGVLRGGVGGGAGGPLDRDDRGLVPAPARRRPRLQRPALRRRADGARRPARDRRARSCARPRLPAAQHQRPAPRARSRATRSGSPRPASATVFLQFDGVDDEPYRALRGRPLAAVEGARRPPLRRGRAGRRARADGRPRREPRPPRRDPRLRPASTRRRCAASTSSRWRCSDVTPPPATPARTG